MQMSNTIDKSEESLEKQQYERELASVRERYKNIIENLNDAIGAVDETGRVTYISSSIKKILGYEPEEMIGRHYLNFIHPADRQRVKERVRQFSRGDTPNINTNRLVSKDGKIVWVQFSDSPVKTTHEPKAFYTVLTDVSATKQLQEELIKKESRALAGELAAFVAHDINTPLQGVLSILEHCRNEYEENRELLEFITLMQTGLLKIKSTVLNLLELENPIIYDTTNVNVYLRKVFHLAESYLRFYGIKVELELNEDIPEASISTKDFEQMLLEIIREEVWWFGREDWDTYPAFSVFDSGRKVVEQQSGDDAERLYKNVAWEIRSDSDANYVDVVFFTSDPETAEDGAPCDRFGILENIIHASNCKFDVDVMPGTGRKVRISIPMVQEKG